ncbi:hypothetical protein [Niastella populi]|uniref:2-isopropylmalate synthase LeuA allosteric (dimerisation) domain-containing protein n=1 Tax=Niastella populi TaxID=550983 RepID=A0A1V9FJI9_9BACT|nr:hypothetical protein [Niastella populi]OQP58457.1 hypothetical protein A4R26_03090 [Niastella populi]
MKNSYLLHIDEQTTQGISLEDISYLSSFKANLLEEQLAEIYIIEITLSNPGANQVAALVKIGAHNGEFTGYSVAVRWETAITKAFESIRYHLHLITKPPVQENIN